VMVAGINTRIEVWDVKAWIEVRAGFESNATGNAEHWAKLGV